MIYLDNAATSWPKPDCVPEAITRFLRDVGANPGRSGHRRANEAERTRFDAREAVASLLGVSDPLRIVFTLNATAALNIVIQGLLPPDTHVVTTGMEHNAVTRPLRMLQQRGVSISIAPCDRDGKMDEAALDDLIRPETRLIVANHASNVSGTLLPIRRIGERARARSIPFLVDAAQTAGCLPIDLDADNIDLLAFTGHKSLLGPTGTGGVAIGSDFDISRLPPLICGGTGSGSEHMEQPDFLPDKYESGTPNIVGLAGLAAGVGYVLDRGVDTIRAHEKRLARHLIAGLGRLRSVTVVGPRDPEKQIAVVSFVVAGVPCSDVAFALDEQFNILCRPGLHCAPLAHESLGTMPDGTVRFAPGPFTTVDEIDQALAAIVKLAGVES